MSNEQIMPDDPHPIEPTPVITELSYTTECDSLTDALAFVMHYLQYVGKAPHVEITPSWIITDDDDGDGSGEGHVFEARVSGRIEKRREQAS
jgi:hypothetical protein